MYIDFDLLSDTDIGAEHLSEEDNIVDYLWNIDNKYYTSQILVRTIESKSCKFPVEGINALIVYHDPQAVRYIIALVVISTYLLIKLICVNVDQFL